MPNSLWHLVFVPKLQDRVLQNACYGSGYLSPKPRDLLELLLSCLRLSCQWHIGQSDVPGSDLSAARAGWTLFWKAVFGPPFKCMHGTFCKRNCSCLAVTTNELKNDMEEKS